MEMYMIYFHFFNFFKNKEYKHNYEYIKEKKKQDYENKKGNIEEYLKSITNMVYDASTFLINLLHQIIQQKKKKN